MSSHDNIKKKKKKSRKNNPLQFFNTELPMLLLYQLANIFLISESDYIEAFYQVLMLNKRRS